MGAFLDAIPAPATLASQLTAVDTDIAALNTALAALATGVTAFAATTKPAMLADLATISGASATLTAINTQLGTLDAAITNLPGAE